MARRKIIQCFCHGVISAGPQYKTHWEDVWLRWEQPRNTIQRAAPMIATRADLEAELWLAEDLLRQYGDGHASDVAYNKRMLAILDVQPFARDDWSCPNVYTNAEYIDRAEAERMLSWFLSDVYGISRPKFVWRRNKDRFVVRSVSFAGIGQCHEEPPSDDALDSQGGGTHD